MKLTVLALLVLGVAGSRCDAQFLGDAPGEPRVNASRVDSNQLQELLHVKRAELVFRPDDVLAVQVYGVKEYAVEQRVADDGTVTFPLVGKLTVAGLGVQELESAIASRLKEGGFVRDPQVTARAVSQPWAVVTVSGDVAKPGVFPAYGNLTLMDYLSEAGGLVEYVPYGGPTVNVPASSTVTLVRSSLPEPVSIPLGADAANSPYGRIPLLPGDEVRVGKVGIVYAVGALRAQGAFAMKNTSPTTVLQVVAQAGGIGYEADKGDARIIRTVGSSKLVLSVDVGKMLKGELADLPLQSDDILFVPTNQMKAAIKGGGSGLIVSLASAYLYAQK